MSNKAIGKCHCGSIEFEIEFLEDFEKVRRCDCSFCAKRWAVVASVPVEKLEVLKGQKILTLYQWGTMTAKHYFCSRCGIYTHHQRRSDPTEFGVNIACFDWVDVRNYTDIEIFDGKNHPSDD